MTSDKVYNSDELLTKMECCNLFCKKLKISQGSYYKFYRKFIKFHYAADLRNEFGGIHQRIPRIPRRVVIGLIHWLTGQYDKQHDPPMEELERFLAKSM
jgi:hypothetical protein